MHFFATNTICSFNNTLSVIISPISYNKVLIQTINKQRLEVNTRRLISLKNNTIIKVKITDNSSVEEVHKELMGVYSEYQKLVDEEVVFETDFDRFKFNLKKKIEKEILEKIN